MERTRFEPGWLGRQFEKAESDIKQWPEWKRRLVEADRSRKAEQMKDIEADLRADICGPGVQSPSKKQ